jgi:hypothetical protein
MAEPSVRRADFLMTLAYETDLATGRSRDFALRSCVLAMRLAATPEARKAARRVTLARADEQAVALAPIIAEIQAGGITTPYAIAADLMRRGIPTAQGRRFWGGTQVRTIGRTKIDAMADLGLTSAAGIDPGMAYDLQWQMVQRIAGWIWRSRRSRSRIKGTLKRSARDLPRPRKAFALREARLAALTIKSDADDPLQGHADLTVLTDAELDTLKKLCLKAGAGHTGATRPDVTSRQLLEPRMATSRRRPIARLTSAGRLPARKV